MLGECSTTELHLKPNKYFFFSHGTEVWTLGHMIAKHLFLKPKVCLVIFVIARESEMLYHKEII
jgi:hypothetical protein